jgi:hypothetical protein
MWWRVVPRYAAVIAVAVLAGFGVLRHREHQAMVESVANVTPFASVLQPEIIKDFDAIRQLRYVPVVSDEELLAALQ